MLLMFVLGLFTTLLGVVLGSAVLELTVRALGHSLAARPARDLVRTRAGSGWHPEM